MKSLCDVTVAVIAPTFNRRDITIQFIRKINSQGIPLKIYISDSESTDGTVAAAASEPNVRVVFAGAKAWWSAAVNRGIEQAKSDGANVFIVMNDDVGFEMNLLVELLAIHRKHPLSILTPLQNTSSGPFVGTFYEGAFRQVRHMKRIPEDGFIATSNGCCLLIPLQIFNAVGLFNEKNCPHLYGDTEFQLRALKAGFPTRPCGEVEINQMAATNYYARLLLPNIFTFEGSPLHLRAYCSFGRVLFGSNIKFLLFGLRFHFDFIKTLAKTLRFISRRKLKMMKDRYAPF